MDIIGFGALNYDRLYKVDSLNAGDDEIFIKEEHESAGGSGANTIYALGKLGLKSGFVGAVGSDHEGDAVRDSFSSVGVDLSGITVKKGSRTSMILGFVDKHGERALYVSPKANSELTEGDADLDYIRTAKFLLLSSFVDDAQFKLQVRAVEALPDGHEVIFMPGALYSKRGYDELEPILSRTKILFLNTEEMKMLLDESVKTGSDRLINKGISTVAVTLGSAGSYIRSKNGQFEIPAVKTDVVDTTGAGDAFAAGFIWGYHNGMEPEKCGIIGNYVASCCIKEMGARPGIPDENELRAYLETLK